jgi:hypothetical protein
MRAFLHPGLPAFGLACLRADGQRGVCLLPAACLAPAAGPTNPRETAPNRPAPRPPSALASPPPPPRRAQWGEVAICFGGKLMRGNRASKVDSSSYQAFDTPSYPYLATLGIGLAWNHRLLLPLEGAYRPRRGAFGGQGAGDIGRPRRGRGGCTGVPGRLTSVAALPACPRNPRQAPSTSPGKRPANPREPPPPPIKPLGPPKRARRPFLPPLPPPTKGSSRTPNPPTNP